jgi:tRNA nucleotidyltransferase (CCA-adding enzyme)
VERVRQVREELVRRAREEAANLSVPLKEALVAGRLDLDLFLLFDPALPRERLAESGLALATRLLTDPVRRYADHPYLRGEFQGFAVDAVPGYRVDRSDRPITPVDRTPFHQAFLLPRQTPRMRDDVRLLKRFLGSLGVYGAEVRTEGLSGYLTELLVLRFGSFGGVVRAARDWRIPQRLCPPGPEPTAMEDAALILPDPVDPHRNVASALSRRSFAVFLLGAREYTEHPRREFFHPPPDVPLPLETLLARLGERQSTVTVLLLKDPGKVPDVVWPQLRKAERALRETLERVGFTVLGTASALAGGKVAVLVETDRSTLSPVRVHAGPPVGIRETPQFLARWTGEGPAPLKGPYLTYEGRLAVDLRRDPREVLPILSSLARELALGKDLRTALPATGAFHPLNEVLGEVAVREALADLLDDQLPWNRWGRTSADPPRP